ncbi:MAG: DNA-binding domain-containing protein [Myxococcales bacterium]
MNLAELQRYFAAAATSGAGPLAGLDLVFESNDHLSASERLAIYNRAFFYRQLDALASVFSATRRALGEPEFERLGLGYLATHPSEHPAVERVGRRFPEYLRQVDVSSSEPIVDLARLEWVRLCALVAPNPAALAQPNAVDPAMFPSCRVKLVPSLSWLELDSRALSLLAGAAALPGPSERCAVAVWRAGHAVVHERVETLEFRALCAASAGATMAEVCAGFDTGQELADVQRAFGVVSSWYARSWLENVEFTKS